MKEANYSTGCSLISMRRMTQKSLRMWVFSPQGLDIQVGGENATATRGSGFFKPRRRRRKLEGN